MRMRMTKKRTYLKGNADNMAGGTRNFKLCIPADIISTLPKLTRHTDFVTTHPDSVT